MSYVRTGTEGYMNTYRRVLLDGYTCTVAKKDKSVETLGKKQTDRDVVCRVCTRLVQIQRDSPRIREI